MDSKNIYRIMAIGLILFVSINNASASDRSITVTEKNEKRIKQVKPGDSKLQGEIVIAMQKLIDSARKAASNIRGELKKFEARTNHSIKRTDVRPFLDLAHRYDELASLAERKKSALGKSSRVKNRKDLKSIEDMIKDVEDDQSMVQFKIQMATSDLQNAENVRSQAEKRLEQQRKDLTRNWAG